MSYRKILSKLPAFDNKKVVDNYMARLDTHGVSRRQFLSFASAGAAAVLPRRGIAQPRLGRHRAVRPVMHPEPRL